MPVTLYDLVDQTELEQMMNEGRINKQVHPKLPLSIYNYTNKAQFEGKWSNAERMCRGLIVEDETLEVIAMGPKKFFNYNQPGAPLISPDDPVRVTRKEDGSLGIGWFYKDQDDVSHYGIATRGSFTSDQAVHATAMLDDRLKNAIWVASVTDGTMIFEIVYPENRIVLDYGTRDELIPLGVVDVESGIITDREDSILADRFINAEWMTFEEALRLPIPHDEEGYVLDILEPVVKFSGTYYATVDHIKLKGEDYKILHGLLTNTNARRLWVQLAARECHAYINSEEEWTRMLHHRSEDFMRVDVSKDIVETFLTNVPDEFYDWVTKKIDSIQDRVADLLGQSLLLAGQASLIEDKRSRYEHVKDHPMCREILQYVQNRDYSRLVIKAWQLAKPEGNDTPFRVSDD